MTKTIMHRGERVEIQDDTPVTIKGLSQALGWGRNRIYADIARGYKMEFGTETTLGHYLAWLRVNPREPKVSGSRVASSKLERELSKLR